MTRLASCLGAFHAIALSLATAGGCSPSSDSSTPHHDAGTGATVSEAAASQDAAGTALDSSSTVDNSTPPVLVPSNFDTSVVILPGVGQVDVPGGNGNPPCTLDTDQGTLSCANQTTPFPVVVTPVTLPMGGGHATLFAMTYFKVDPGTVLTVTGTKPAIIYCLGNVDIEGLIDLAAHGTTDGPGAFHTQGPGQGSDGALVTDADSGTSTEVAGAGGASYCGSGGGGAPVLADGGLTSAAGATYGTDSLIPLLGGSAGGSHTSTGYGGGAIQITSNQAIKIGAAGGINANGSGGDNHAGVGGGGGSGGSILLEAASVTVAGTLTANGGAGGDTNQVGPSGNFSNMPALGGGMAGGTGSGDTVINGQDGTTSQSTNFGGGGGGAGRIRINNADGTSTALTGTFSPAIISACMTVARMTTM